MNLAIDKKNYDFCYLVLINHLACKANMNMSVKTAHGALVNCVYMSMKSKKKRTEMRYKEKVKQNY